MDQLFGLVSFGPAGVDASKWRQWRGVGALSLEEAWACFGVQPRATRPPSAASRFIATSPSGRFAVALAGALHYRDDLVATLGQHLAAHRDDHAVLAAHAWERWSIDTPTHLEGVFALAVHDTHERSLVLVQSRVEHTPLYYMETPDGIAFATAWTMLTELPGMSRSLDVTGFVRAVSQYTIQAADLSRTPVQGIKRLAAASRCVRGGRTRRDDVYWAPRQGPTAYRTEAEVHEEVRARVDAALGERIARERTVAFELSGGLDSSSLMCLGSDSHPQASLLAVGGVLARGCEQADGPDERPFIELVVNHTGVDVTWVTPEASVNPWYVPHRTFDAVASPALSPGHYLNDALFAAAAGAGAGVVVQGTYGELGPSFRARGTLRTWRERWSSCFPARWIARPASSRDSWMFAAVRDDLLHDTGVAREMELQRRAVDSSGGLIGTPPLWQKVARPVPDARLYGIETAQPFRDPRVWEYCAGLPVSLTTRRGYSRYLIRAAMEGVLPAAIQWRRTKGPYSPDYFTRLRRHLPWLRSLSESVTASETAGQLLDLMWLRREIRALEAGADLQQNRKAMLLQGTAFAIQFLRWFEEPVRHE